MPAQQLDYDLAQNSVYSFEPRLRKRLIQFFSEGQKQNGQLWQEHPQAPLHADCYRLAIAGCLLTFDKEDGVNRTRWPGKVPHFEDETQHPPPALRCLLV